MLILSNFVSVDMRVTAWSRQTHGQASAWQLTTIPRWQHPLPPNNNCRRARYDKPIESAYGSRAAQTKIGRTTDEASRTTGRQPLPPQLSAQHRGTPARLPFGSLRSALTGVCLPVLGVGPGIVADCNPI